MNSGWNANWDCSASRYYTCNWCHTRDWCDWCHASNCGCSSDWSSSAWGASAAWIEEGQDLVERLVGLGLLILHLLLHLLLHQVHGCLPLWLASASCATSRATSSSGSVHRWRDTHSGLGFHAWILVVTGHGVDEGLGSSASFLVGLSRMTRPVVADNKFSWV